MKRVNIKCPYCGATAYLRPASVAYGERAIPGAKLYVCGNYPACDSYVAAHRGTQLPMGTLANKDLRRQRQEAHTVFNQLWNRGLMTKRQAYLWLQARLDLPECEAHIAKFSEVRCRLVIHLCQQFLDAQHRAA
ncbi:zinc-finger-containing protein [Candidatus Avoscillospira sp. LCP25S3_F1]|uniref:zinc-finger-containing protein n=1 Tax=Candidatus Avoscillospira sp. LCP25S3_F1 TaxID=3438825 RepID=UPI003F8D9468